MDRNDTDYIAPVQTGVGPSVSYSSKLHEVIIYQKCIDI